MKIFGVVIAFFAGIFALTIFLGTWYTVDQGDRGVVLRYGAVVDVADAGLHFKLPLIEDVIHISTQQHTRIYENMQAYSKDQQPANIKVSVSYKVDPTQVGELYAQYGSIDNVLTRVLDRKTPEELKNVFGKFNAATAIQDRGKLNLDIENAVKSGVNATSPIIVESVQIEDINFSEAYENSIEQKQLAEVEVQKEQNVLAREEIKARIAVTQASARADSLRAEKQAEADGIRLMKAAEADGIKMKGAALAENPLLVELTKAERWSGTLPTTMIPGSAVPFVNVR